MNNEMAYLIGMILGNGEIQRGMQDTTVTIDIPHKNLLTDDGKDVEIYVKASLMDIMAVVNPLLGTKINYTSAGKSTKISFTKSNTDYAMREIVRLIGSGVHHSTMTVSPELFELSADEKKSLLRGFADVTGYIRRSNIAFGQEGAHRVYLEIPGNWQLLIDIANMLKSIDIPVQTIDFGHPNFRDPQMKKYNEGAVNYWKKEHQLKIWAVEFKPVGFIIKHKEQALMTLSAEQEQSMDTAKTHLFYWEKKIKQGNKPIHPGENDESLPAEIRGKHFDSWTELAKELGYHE